MADWHEDISFEALKDFALLPHEVGWWQSVFLATVRQLGADVAAREASRAVLYLRRIYKRTETLPERF